MWSTTCWTLDLVDIRECIKKREITDVRKSGVFLLTAEKSGRGEGGWRKGERDGLIRGCSGERMAGSNSVWMCLI